MAAVLNAAFFGSRNDLDALGNKILSWTVDGPVPKTPTAEMPLASFSTAVYIVIAYLSLVAGGSAAMVRSPKPINTYAARFAYNLVQVMLCSYMTIEALILAYRNYGLNTCNAFNTTNPVMGNVLWLFYVSKVLDFADTTFIILGKNWRQLSFLHVYHHASIFMMYWMNMNVNYDGDIYLTIVLNGFIHGVMYTYYFVSMHTKDIWWKKYMTMMQLIQFTGMMSQAVLLLATDCQAPTPRVTKVYLYYILSLFGLFMNFYIRSYMSGKPKPAAKAPAPAASPKLTATEKKLE